MKIIILVLFSLLLLGSAEKLPTEDKNNFIECLRKCVTWQEAARIILKCTDEPDFGKCVLDSVVGRAKECVLNCLGTKDSTVVELPVIELPKEEKRPEDKNRFVDCLKKCVTWQEAVRIILKCTDQSDFGKCILDSVVGRAKECVLNCLEIKTELPSVKLPLIELPKEEKRPEDKNRFVDCLKKNV